MPTIYLLGDPELLREALLALATIFNLADWYDPGSAFGLGGNFLAMGLIGLLAVAIAAITSQEFRLDYLLLAFLLFAIAFGVKTDVNVEDIQTGDSTVVADVPAGVAYVAGAASGAARALAETTSAALQRPGSATSVLTVDGFLNPMKTLLAIREMSLLHLSGNVYKSMLEYYKFCVGLTIENSPGTFDLDEFRSTPNPEAYLFDTANIDNYSTTYYTDADPGGVAQSCHATAPLLQDDIEDLTTGATDAVEAYLTRTLGTDTYNTSFDLTDIENAVDIVFRGAMSGQEFMTRLLLRNFHNTGEAWRLAEYGSNQAQYVASITDAMETKRVSVATEGSVFLQFMLPLMSFFQFLFFAIAPFIALIMIASPFSTVKVLGMYLLFGVWTYMWMPVAAVINHYMEISLQNAIEFAGTAGFNTGHTALLGLDDFYNLAATKLAIGSQALAATPMIVAAVLSATIFTLTSMAGRFAKAGSADHTNTSLAAPRIGQSAPLATVGGRGSFPTGTVVAPLGRAPAPSTEQRRAYERIDYRQAATTVVGAGRSAVQQASRSYESSVTTGINRLNQIASSGSTSTSAREVFATTTESTIRQVIAREMGNEVNKSLSAGQIHELGSNLGISTPFVGANETSRDTAVADTRFGDIERTLKGHRGEIGARIASSLATESSASTQTAGELRETAQRLESAQEEYEEATTAQRHASETASRLQELSRTASFESHELAETASLRWGADAADRLYAQMTGEFNSRFAGRMRDGGRAIFDQRRPAGIDGLYASDGRGDRNMDTIDQISTQLMYLSKEAAKGDPQAARALLKATEFIAGVGDPRMVGGTSQLLDHLAGARESVARGEETFEAVRDQRAASGRLADEYGRLQEQADGRVNRGGQEPRPLSEARRAGVHSRHSGDSDRVRDDASLRSVSPELAQQHEALKQHYGDVVAGAGTETTGSDILRNLMKPGSGFNDVLMDDLAPLAVADGSRASTDEKADQAISRLQGAVLAQFHSQLDLQPVYQRYQDAGFTKKQAALATYGELGRRTAGASDLFVAGLSSAIGAETGSKAAARRGLNKSLLSVARMGGHVAGVGLFALGVGIAKRNDTVQGEAAARLLGEHLKADFRQVNPDAYAEFAQQIDAQKNIQGVANVLSEFYETGQITDDHIDSFQPDRKYVAGNWGFQRVQPTTANPFSQLSDEDSEP